MFQPAQSWPLISLSTMWQFILVRYLWVALQLDAIFRSHQHIIIPNESVIDIVGKLPNSLPEAFDQALARISDRRYGMKSFRLVTAAAKTLTGDQSCPNSRAQVMLHGSLGSCRTTHDSLSAAVAEVCSRWTRRTVRSGVSITVSSSTYPRSHLAIGTL